MVEFAFAVCTYYPILEVAVEFVKQSFQQSILVIEVVESKIFEDFQQRFGCNDVMPMLVNAVIFADLRICINNQS